MISKLRTAAILALLGLVWGTGGSLEAQGHVVRPLDSGGPPGDTVHSCLTDAMLAAAVTAFNGPAVTRIYGTNTIAAQNSSQGTIAVLGGPLRLDGAVHGDVIVINGDMRLAASGRVDGTITVLGGRLDIDPGAAFSGQSVHCGDFAPVHREPDGTLTIRRKGRFIGDVTSAAASFDLGPFRTTLHGNVGAYNRVESLPLKPGVTSIWQADSLTSVQIGLTGIVRTASDPSGNRSDLGWSTSLSVTHAGAHPLTVGLSGGSTIVPTADQPTTATESALSAALLRRDYRDWYQSNGVAFFARYVPFEHLTTNVGWGTDRETTVRAVDAFSLLRNGEAWRPNPLVDDGKFRTSTIGATWDTRDDVTHPASGLLLHGEFTHVSSNDLTPVSLPTTIRDALPTTGYAETEFAVDARMYMHLDPRLGLHVRVAASGWFSGDPLTVQRRLAAGGLDPLPGYSFRAVNCDRVRRPDPALPALCDRQMSIQAELRRTIDFNLSTRIGGYTIGVQRPTLVAFGDLGTAWLVGDTAGRVPRTRLQNIGEWRSEIGIGIDAGRFGLYLAKALADPDPVRLILRLTPRF